MTLLVVVARTAVVVIAAAIAAAALFLLLLLLQRLLLLLLLLLCLLPALPLPYLLLLITVEGIAVPSAYLNQCAVLTTSVVEAWTMKYLRLMWWRRGRRSTYDLRGRGVVDEVLTAYVVEAWSTKYLRLTWWRRGR